MPSKRILRNLVVLISLILAGTVLLQTDFFLKKQANATATSKRVLVLGFDGLDPQLLEHFVQAGKLPHFQAFMEKGYFHTLGTTVPPLSPVAWATFTTGMNPGDHGIFDFIHRDPHTLIPYLSTSRSEPAKRTVQIGSWVIPLSSGKVTLLREGQAFWRILEDHGIPTTVIRAPANFPPVKSEGRQLSGMGTPDLKGTYGLYSFFTDEPLTNSPAARADPGGEVYLVHVANQQVHTQLLGPDDSFRVGNPPSAVDFSVFIDPTNPVAKIVIQDQSFLLKEGEWTPWIHLRFELIPFLQHVNGMVRFYLKETHPRFKLYATPVNIDPAAPALPISTPDTYAQELSEELGPFYTQGMPFDTKALSNGILEDGEFLQQSRIVLDEQTRMYEYELSRFTTGLFFFYSDFVDQLCHMFWRTMDSHHPLYDPTSVYAPVIEATYQSMDTILGKAMNRVDEQTTLIVMSDHGFAPFYRTFALNQWLKNEGYIKQRDGFETKEGGFFPGVSWGNTKAYGLGINGLYINLKGREPQGRVQPGAEREALVQEIADKLLSVIDPKTGEQIIHRVYKAEEIYNGPQLANAPDLVIGYNRGYRVSWESVLGSFSATLFADNTDKWSGDHSMAADLVPGVLLANKKITGSDPHLRDLAPTILHEFGLAKGAGMIGNIVF